MVAFRQVILAHETVDLFTWPRVTISLVSVGPLTEKQNAIELVKILSKLVIDAQLPIRFVC